MRKDDFFPSSYLKAIDLPDDGKDFVIKEVVAEAFNENEQEKPVASFEGETKKLVLNKTNWNTIVQNTGKQDSDDWVGTTVTLYPSLVEFRGDKVLAIRIKDDVSAALAQKRAAAGVNAPASKTAEATTTGGDDEPIPF